MIKSYANSDQVSQSHTCMYHLFSVNVSIIRYNDYQVFVAIKSYGYCQSLKINDIREQCRVCLTICEAGGIFCETMGGGVHRDTETLSLSAAQTHTANVMGVRPPGFEVFCIRKCGSNSNACFVYVRSGRILFAL